MSNVSRGLGLPETGAIVAGGLGSSEPAAPGSIRGTAAGSCTVVGALRVVWQPSGDATSDSSASAVLALPNRSSRRGYGGANPVRPWKREFFAGVAESSSSAQAALSVVMPVSGLSAATSDADGNVLRAAPLSGVAESSVSSSATALMDDSVSIMLLVL